MTTPYRPNSSHRQTTTVLALLASLVVTLGFLPLAQADPDFTVFGHEGVWLQQNSRVTSGDVGANLASPGPFLSDGVEVTFGPGARVDAATSRVFGHRVSLNISAQVFDVHTNALSGIGTVLGQTITPLDLPVVGSLPPVPAITPGPQDVDVPLFTTQTLDAGSYGSLTVGAAATLTLTGGVYEFASWSVGNSARVQIAGPTEIRIAGKVFVDHIARVEPAPTAPTITASDILVVVTGINGSTGALNELPKAASFGQATTIRAKLHVPNGTLEIQQNSQATGAFLGKWVILGPGVFANFEGGFGLTVGGGGGNTPPVAEAGPDQTVQVTDTVQLDGSGSTDVDGDMLTFAWTLVSLPAGSSATLSDPTAVMPTFVVDLPGTYEAELIVNDGTVDSTPDTVTITTINSPPVADAGPDQTVFVTQSVLLDGTGSSDVDNDALTFLWSFVSIPNGSSATLSDPTSPTPDFTVDQPGTYDIQLIVNDGTVDSNPDSVTINTQNSQPVAEAGADQTVSVGATVQLDGRNSSDVDGDPLTVQWSFTALPPGSTATLSDPLMFQPTFIADLPGVYVAQLMVNDGTDDSDPDTVTITATNTAPIAEAGPDQTVSLGTTVLLDGSASSDPDSDPLTFQWTITSRPAGSTATLSDPTVVNPTFLADQSGSYVVELLVNDGTEDSTPDNVVITTENAPPVANAGPDQNVSIGATVQLDGSSSSDADADPLTFQWSLTTKPVGSTTTLSDATVVNPTFVADQFGTYTLELIVNDGTVDSAPDTVTITVTNDPPILTPIGNRTIPLGQSLTVTLTGSDPNGDALSFTATPLPLPTGMSLNATTGVLTFQPTADQVGPVVVNVLVSDGIATDSETVTFTVQGPQPGDMTGLTGRILDTNDFVSGGGTETPVVGATVSLLGTSFSTTSDTQGFFTLTGIPGEAQVLDIDAATANPSPDSSTYASFREQINLITNVTNVVDRPFFLPRNDPNSQMLVNGNPVNQVDPTNTTVVTNANLGVTLTVAAHNAKNPDGTDYAGPLSISEVPANLAPAALPEDLNPAMLITIQPPGVIFNTPAPLTLPNLDQMTPGNEVHLWSLDPATGKFAVVGRGQVSADGTSLITIEGGVRATDWHGFLCVLVGAVGDFFGLGGDSGNPNQGNDPNSNAPHNGGNQGNGDSGCSGSQTEFCSGSLSVQHELPTYRSISTDRTATLRYDSLSADPQPIIFNFPTIPVESAVPSQVSARLIVAGIEQNASLFTDTSGLSESVDETIRQALQFDAATWETGSYPYQLIFTNHFLRSSISARVNGTVLVNNQRANPIGAGWTLEGLSRVHRQSNGDVLLSTGRAETILFRTPKAGIFEEHVNFFLPFSQLNGARVVVEDVNGDQILDWVVPAIAGAGSRADVYFGNGDGTVTFDDLYVIGGRSSDFHSADFDQDGNVDLFAVNEIQGTVTVLYGDGNGAFSTFFSYPMGFSPRRGVVADLNGDTILDVATTSSDNTIAVRLGVGGQGPAAFGPVIPSANLGSPGPSDIVAADFNQDGHLDLATADNNHLSLLLGDGTGQFPTVQFIAGPTFVFNLKTADLNQDGYPDLATVGGISGSGDAVFVLLNNRVGGFWPPEVHFLNPPLGSRVDIEVADFNNDGHLDVVTADLGNGGSVTVLSGDGSGGFPTMFNVPVGDWAIAVTPADLDNNGTIDLVVPLDAPGAPDRVVSLRNQAPGDALLAPAGEFSTLTENADSTFTRRLKDGTQIQYDANGFQTAVTDRNGNTTTYTYNPQGQLETITDPAGLTTTFAYTGDHLASITDPANRTTTFEHDAGGNLITITDPDLSVREFSYDPRHRMVSQTSKRNLVTQYEYNFAGRMVKASRPDGSTREIAPSDIVGLIDPASGVGTETNPAPVVRPTEVVATFTDGKGEDTTVRLDVYGKATVRTDALGRTTTISRNNDGNPVVTTTPNGAITRRTYDDRGNVLSVIDAEGQPEARTTQFEYDPTFNLLTKITDPAGKETTIERDANGNPDKVIDPLQGERARTFDSRGLVLTDTDENDKTTTFTYDANGNVETRTDPEGNVTRFLRDAAGNVMTLIEGEGTPEQRTRTLAYDSLNRLTSATDGTPAVTQFRYDTQGNLLETELPTGETEVRTYDPMDRVASIDDPIGGLTQFTYDPNGNLEQTLNALNDPTGFEYDEANQLTKITDALNGEQVFTYDLEGNVKTFTDARTQTTTFEYDLLNRQTKRTNVLNQETIFTYDTRDNLETTRDPKNQLITRTYDDLSRLTTIITPDNTIGMAYDAVGNPTQVTDNDSEVGFTYDGLNRTLTTSTVDQGAQPAITLTNVWNAVDNRTSLTDTAPGTTLYEYDLAGRLTKLTTPASLAITLGYDLTGRLASILFPNGVVSDYQYDTKGRLATLSHTLGSDPSFASFGYTYNPVGNITAILDQVNPTENRSFTYDVLQRLKTGGTTNTPETYDYDLVGNRTSSFLSTTHTHDGANRLTDDDQFTYTYDANGNLATKMSKVNPTELTTYTWDAQDQLVQINFPNSTTATYKYDGFGRRIEKNVNGTITRYIYDGEDILLEYDGTNTFVARYNHGDQVDQPLAVQRAGVGFFYYQADHQGSIRNLTDSSGTIANSYIYDSYGRTLAVAESVPQPFTYTGRELDAESDLYYYRARYYEPESGRFLSEDPIGFAGGDQNLYGYVLNNPLNFVDPFGLCPGRNRPPNEDKEREFCETVGALLPFVNCDPPPLRPDQPKAKKGKKPTGQSESETEPPKPRKPTNQQKTLQKKARQDRLQNAQEDAQSGDRQSTLEDLKTLKRKNAPPGMKQTFDEGGGNRTKQTEGQNIP